MTGLAKSKSHPMSDWSKARVDKLKNDWANGDPASHIANKLGISRNAVIGKVHRLKLDSHASRRSPKSKPRAEPVRLATVMGTLVPEPLPNNDADIPLAQRRALLDLEPYHCRWPMGGPTEKAVWFCGGPADINAGQPYCQGHAARALVGVRQLYVSEKAMT